MNDTKDCGCSVNAIKIAELEKRIDLHVKYQQDAVARAATELRERLAAMNEFREQLREQAAKFVTRNEMELHFEAISTRFRWGVGTLLALITLILSGLLLMK
jgi:hypothetical protein